MRNERRFAASKLCLELAVCGLLALVVLIIHGYHPYSEDAGIYVPAIKKMIDPSLYSYGAHFFERPAHFSLFAFLVSASSRLFLLPIRYVLLAWYLITTATMIYACYRICRACFPEKQMRIVGTLLIVVAASMPAAGTALLLSDPYLTGRSFSTPAVLFAIAFLLEEELRTAFLFLGIALLFHPLMGAAGLAFVLVFLAVRHKAVRMPLLISALLFFSVVLALAFKLHPVIPESYRQALMSRAYFFLSNWRWFEILGAVAPIVLCLWLAYTGRSIYPGKVVELAIAISIFGSTALVLGVVATWVTPALTLARFQPMRAFHLIYFLFILIPFNLGLRAILKQRTAAYALILLGIAGGMYISQRRTFPASAHIEWPWHDASNPWQEAFFWVRYNTPKNAIFALSPEYSDEQGDDGSGFRAVAERSALADKIKDGGVVALFPDIADEWVEDVRASATVNQLHTADDARLLVRRGAQWVVASTGKTSGLDCVYRNQAVEVCRLPSAPGAEEVAHKPAFNSKQSAVLQPD